MVLATCILWNQATLVHLMFISVLFWLAGGQVTGVYDLSCVGHDL